MIGHMTTAHHERIPALTLGWRLKMALTDSDLTRDDMAHELGKSPSALSRWMRDEGAPPARAYIVRWAQVTHVPIQWLEHGIVVEDEPDPDGGLPIEDAADNVAQLAARKRAKTRRRSTDGYLDLGAAA